MNNLEATYRYRKRIAAAMRTYKRDLIVAFEEYGRPIPVNEECGKSFEMAWRKLVTTMQFASYVLNKARECP